MNRNDRSKKHYDEVLDTMLREVLLTNAAVCYGNIPSEQEIKQYHTFSPQFQKNMNRLFEQCKEQEQALGAHKAGSVQAAEEMLPGERSAEEQAAEEMLSKRWFVNGLKADQLRHDALTEEDLFFQKLIEADMQEREQRCAEEIAALELELQTYREKAANRAQDTGEPFVWKRIEQSNQPDTVPADKASPAPYGSAGPQEWLIEEGKQKKRRWKVKRFVKIVAAVVIVFAVAVNGWMLSPIRASFRQTLLDYEGQGFLVTNSSEDDYQVQFKDPSFIPEGYEITMDYEGENSKCLEYANGENTLRIIYTTFEENADLVMDNERHWKESEQVYIKKKYEALIFTSEESDELTCLSWQNGKIQYNIFGFESPDLLIKIAESIVQ